MDRTEALETEGQGTRQVDSWSPCYRGDQRSGVQAAQILRKPWTRTLQRSHGFLGPEALRGKGTDCSWTQRVGGEQSGLKTDESGDSRAEGGGCLAPSIQMNEVRVVGLRGAGCRDRELPAPLRICIHRIRGVGYQRHQLRFRDWAPRPSRGGVGLSSSHGARLSRPGFQCLGPLAPRNSDAVSTLP